MERAAQPRAGRPSQEAGHPGPLGLRGTRALPVVLRKWDPHLHLPLGMQVPGRWPRNLTGTTCSWGRGRKNTRGKGSTAPNTCFYKMTHVSNILPHQALKHTQPVTPNAQIWGSENSLHALKEHFRGPLTTPLQLPPHPPCTPGSLALGICFPRPHHPPPCLHRLFLCLECLLHQLSTSPHPVQS